MRNDKKTRGSAMIIVVFVVTAVGVAVVAGLSLSGSVSNSQSKLERAQELKYVTNGAVQLALSDLSSGVLLLGGSKTYYIGGNAVTVTAADNSGVLANSAKLTISGSSQGTPISTIKTVAYLPSVIDNVWAYGIYSNGGFTFPALGSKVTGSSYFRNSITIVALGQVTKDFKTSSSFNPLGLLTIGGAILTGIVPKTYPTISDSTYTASASSVLTGDQTLNGYTFPTTNAIVVVNGNLSVQGTINGDGTLYVTGNVTVNGNVTRQAGAHHIAIVAQGTITFDGPGSSMTADGYYFSANKITLTDSLTCTGGLVANTFTVSSGFNVTWDSWITQTAANGQSLHVPAMWP